MKALILAAGYATRLYPLTKDRAKPLLPVGDRPVIGHILERIEGLPDLEEILVITNHKFAHQFEKWARTVSTSVPLTVLDDGSVSEEDRLGAIGDIRFAIQKKKIQQDLLVIGGDNLFDFQLAPFISFAKKKVPFCSVMLYDVKDFGLARQYGIVSLDGQGKVAALEEKPAHPKSTLAGMAVYFFPTQILIFFEEYERLPHSKDAPGFYIKWLVETKGVYGYVANGIWYDIGDLASYEKAREAFEKGVRS